MDYGTAFSYVFQDKDWIKKILIGAVITLVPIVNFALLGYTIEIMRRVARGETEVLPDWGQFGELFKKGLLGFVVGLVYLLPVILIVACSAVANIGLVAVASGADSDTAGLLVTASTVLQACFYCLAFILAIAGGLLQIPALGVLGDTGQLGPALRIGEVAKLLRSSPGPFIIAILILGVVSSILAPIGVLACVVGVFVVSAYISAVGGHLYGQAYREAKGKSGMMMQPAM